MQDSNTKPLKYIFDIDGTICSQEKDYADAKPYTDMILLANSLYDQGNIIVYYTARGTETGIDWSEVTIQQLSDWGVKYHDLKFGKPAADVYVDDKGCNANYMLSEDATDSLTVVNKCWGKEYLLDVTKNYAMKKLFVEAGKNLSLQYHVHKSETWHIVDGSGIARVDGKEFRVNIGDTIRIPAGTIHQVKAITNLVIIESSTTELDDIVRIKRSF